MAWVAENGLFMKTFQELGVSPEILKAVVALGYEHPMPVQEQVIPLLLQQDNDVIALAQTGTGKTAAFGLPLIQKADISVKTPQAIVLCPTRELCVQISGDLTDYAEYSPDIRILPVYGGASIDHQIQMLRRGVQIVVATPGRLIDLIQRRAVVLDKVKSVVLDEADEMLNMGFSESIDEILASIPEGRQTLLFSATMPAQIASITKKYMRNPMEITIGNKNSGAENVKHLYYMVHARDKYKALKRIADYNPDIYGIVFCRTRKETQEIADQLIQDGYNADSLHGDLSQAQRDMVMQKFRIRHIQLLVATDVAARGLDVNDLTHVIHYQLPDDIEAYTHRSGRTGRAGKTGISVAIVNLKERHLIRSIEKIIGKSFTPEKIPSGEKICERQLFHKLDQMEKITLDTTPIEPFLPSIFRKLEWLDKEEIIKRFITLEFTTLLNYYKDATDLNPTDEPYEGRKKGRNRELSPEYSDRAGGPEEGFERLFINIGKEDGLYPNHLIGLLNDFIPGRRIRLGKIALMKTFSFFEVEKGDQKAVINALKNCTYHNRRVVVDVASPKAEGEEAMAFSFGGKKKGKKAKGGR